MHRKCLNPTAMITDVIKWLRGPPASNVKLKIIKTRTGCQYVL